MKVVINNCYGGFSISKECAELMAAKGCEVAKAELMTYKQRDDGQWYGYGYSENRHQEYERTSPFLVEAVEELGDKANNWASDLKVVEIPDGIEYTIEEYDGHEHVAEVHRTWS